MESQLHVGLMESTVRAHTLLPQKVSDEWLHGAALLWHGRYRQAPSLPPFPLKR